MLIRRSLAFDSRPSNNLDVEDEGGNHECSKEHELDTKTRYNHPLADFDSVFRPTGHNSTSCMGQDRLEKTYELITWECPTYRLLEE